MKYILPRYVERKHTLAMKYILPRYVERKHSGNEIHFTSLRGKETLWQ